MSNFARNLLLLGLALPHLAAAAEANLDLLDSPVQDRAQRDSGAGQLESLRSTATPVFSDEAAPATQPFNGDQTSQLIRVEAFEFVGNTLVDPDLISARLFEIAGNELSVESFRVVPRVVQAIYREQGYLAAARVPIQIVEAGRLRVEILEASLGEVTIEGEALVSPRKLKRLADSTLESGQPLSFAQIQQLNAQISGLYGVDSTAALSPGEALGASDVVVRVTPEARFSGSVDVDNAGSDSLGYEQANVRFSVLSPFAQGNRLSFATRKSEGLSFAGVTLDVAPNSRSLSTVLGASRLSTASRQLTAGKPLSESEVETLRVAASVPVGAIDRLRFQCEQVDEERRSAGTATETVRSRVCGVQAALIVDRPSLRISANVQARRGNQSYALSANSQIDSLEVYNLVLGGRFSSNVAQVSAQVSGQYAPSELPSRYKKSLGGRDGVFAYPSGQNSSDRALIAALEVQRPITEAVSAAIGYQFAKGIRTVDSSAEENKGHVSGVSLGLQGQVSQRIRWFAKAGYKLQSRPFGASTEKDSDGRASRWRGEAGVSYAF